MPKQFLNSTDEHGVVGLFQSLKRLDGASDDLIHRFSYANHYCDRACVITEHQPAGSESFVGLIV